MTNLQDTSPTRICHNCLTLLLFFGRSPSGWTPPPYKYPCKMCPCQELHGHMDTWKHGSILHLRSMFHGTCSMQNVSMQQMSMSRTSWTHGHMEAWKHFAFTVHVPRYMLHAKCVHAKHVHVRIFMDLCL